ncbi:MAG TPA: hypothetical protein VIO33_09450, partial [Burkholderiaceae bacterium]
MSSSSPDPGSRPGRLAQFGSTVVRLFHEYANWLVSISWKRFFALSILLLVISAMLQKLPPFNMSWTEEVRTPIVTPKLPKVPPVPPVPPAPSIKIEPPSKSGSEDISIQIDKNGIRIGPRTAAAVASAASAAASAAGEAAATAASAAAGAAAEIASGAKVEKNEDGSTTITLPGATREQIREAARAAKEAAREVRQQAREAAEEARRQADDARAEAEEARREAEQAVEEARRQIVEAIEEAKDAAREEAEAAREAAREAQQAAAEERGGGQRVRR